MPVLEPPFPERMREAFCRLLEDVPDDEVLKFAKTDKSLLQGARPVMASVPMLRTNIRKVLRASKPYSPVLKDFLAVNSLQARLIVVWSPRALTVALEALEVYFHGRHLIASLLLDDREEVQKLGLERMEAGALDRPAPTDAEREAAAKQLAKDFNWFLQELHGLVAAADDGTNVGGTRLRAERDELANTLAGVERELKQERGQAAKAREALESRITQLQEKNDALQKQAERVRKDADRAGASQHTVETELAELRATLDRQVREGVERELDARRRPWIAKVESRDEEVARANGQGAELLARVQQELAKQEQHDRHHGNRAHLEALLRQFQDAQVRLETARQQALHPLASLDGLAEDLRREILRLQKQLKGPVSVAAFDDLLARINAVTDAGSLTTLREFVGQGAELKVWDVAHLRALYAAIDHRFCLLLDTFVEHNPAAALRRHPLALVRRAMTGQDCCSLYIDGHNLSHVLYEEHFARGGQDADARKLLGDDLVKLFLNGGEVGVRLYFDGPKRSEDALSIQVQRIFSGGQGPHRADRAILEDVAGRLNLTPEATCIVVSDDKDLLSQASLLGALPMRSQEFAALL